MLEFNKYTITDGKSFVYQFYAKNIKNQTCERNLEKCFFKSEKIKWYEFFSDDLLSLKRTIKKGICMYMIITCISLPIIIGYYLDLSNTIDPMFFQGFFLKVANSFIGSFFEKLIISFFIMILLLILYSVIKSINKLNTYRKRTITILMTGKQETVDFYTKQLR